MIKESREDLFFWEYDDPGVKCGSALQRGWERDMKEGRAGVSECVCVCVCVCVWNSEEI